jgi:hypothetical protein
LITSREILIRVLDMYFKREEEEEEEEEEMMVSCS